MAFIFHMVEFIVNISYFSLYLKGCVLIPQPQQYLSGSLPQQNTPGSIEFCQNNKNLSAQWAYYQLLVSSWASGSLLLSESGEKYLETTSQ